VNLILVSSGNLINWRFIDLGFVNIFMKKSLTNRLRLKLRFYTLCLEEDTSIFNLFSIIL
jgi:hypothetical protein